MLQIYCKNNNLTKEFNEGCSLLDIYNGFKLEMPYGPISAKVNNRVECLNFKVYYNKDVEFLDITSASGMAYLSRSSFRPKHSEYSRSEANLPSCWRSS